MKLCSWVRRQWQQNVIGISPPPKYTTWKALAEFLKWQTLNESRKSAKFRRLKAEFDDETQLMFATFNKLIGTLTPAGIIFAFGAQILNSRSPFASMMFIISACVSFIFVIWGLSTRFKVMRKIVDSSEDALMVDDGEGAILDDEDAANIWYYYKWKWHRYNTRLAIDRLFLLACTMLAGTLSILIAGVSWWG